MANLQRPDQLYYRVIDATMDTYLPVLDRYDDMMDDLEDEALEAAEQAAPPLRAAGLGREAQSLLDLIRHARKRKPPQWFQQTRFDSPVFWGAFQLVGRIT